MKEVVDWAVANIGPNVLKYTPDSAEMQQLLRSGAADAVSFWNSLARLEYFGGNTDAALLVPSAIYPVNGYLWVPKGAAHPVLAQVFINWRLAKDVQFPNAWPIDHGPWSELSEGFLGPDYVDQVPDWFAKPTTSTTSRTSTRSRPSRRSTGRRTTPPRRSGRTTTPRRSASRLQSQTASPVVRTGTPTRLDPRVDR